MKQIATAERHGGFVKTDAGKAKALFESCVLFMVIFLVISLLLQKSGFASECTHYASPAGAGSGASASKPFKIADFWRVARPGYTLCLLDGKYFGASSMILPPKNLQGTRNLPITVRALNDGKVTINGQFVHYPVRLFHNDYFVLEGFNARDSVGTVVSIQRSSHNVVRRVAAWDAAEGNNNIFGIHNGRHNLLEDVAGWGIARKIYSSSQKGDYTTIRRAWGRWEGSHVIGPKVTYQMQYNNFNMLIENSLGTWSGERMKRDYTLMDYYGKPYVKNQATRNFNDFKVDQSYGIFYSGYPNSTSGGSTESKILGSIAYIRGTDNFSPPQAIFVLTPDSFEVADTVVYFEPGTHAEKRRFVFRPRGKAAEVNLVAKNLTGIGGNDSSFGSDWRQSQISEGSSINKVPNIFNASTGARLCHRYENGRLSNEPLWPWPMNARIAAGTVESGRPSVDITRTIEEIFGRIPARCRSGAG